MCEESALIEVTDSRVLAQINQMIPALVKAGDALRQAASSGGEVLYRAVLPSGATLAKSRDMAGAVRGFYHGSKGISGHANLVEVKQKGAAGGNLASVMGVASVIVGQYYMNRIDGRLTAIGNEIGAIGDFQDNEYQSRVAALMVQVKKLAAFQSEILGNSELRELEVHRLGGLEQQCTELLGQANLAIERVCQKTELNYEQYRGTMQKTQKWSLYQQALLELFYQMTDLRYALHLGTVSREYCEAALPMYESGVRESREKLSAWHGRLSERLGIDVEAARRRKDGVGAVLSDFIRIFNKNETEFLPVPAETIGMIREQSAPAPVQKERQPELFSQEVNLIARNGKVYYLPQEG